MKKNISKVTLFVLTLLLTSCMYGSYNPVFAQYEEPEFKCGAYCECKKMINGREIKCPGKGPGDFFPRTYVWCNCFDDENCSCDYVENGIRCGTPGKRKSYMCNKYDPECYATNCGVKCDSQATIDSGSHPDPRRS